MNSWNVADKSDMRSFNEDLDSWNVAKVTRASEILARIVRKRHIEVYISRSRSSGGIRKEQKEVFIESTDRRLCAEADLLVLFSPECCATPSGDHVPLSAY